MVSTGTFNGPINQVTNDILSIIDGRELRTSFLDGILLCRILLSRGFQDGGFLLL